MSIYSVQDRAFKVCQYINIMTNADKRRVDFLGRGEDFHFAIVCANNSSTRAFHIPVRLGTIGIAEVHYRCRYCSAETLTRVGYLPGPRESQAGHF